MGNRAFSCWCDKEMAEDLRVCSIHAENKDEVGLSPHRKVITRALRYRVTPRQRQCMTLYYGQGLNQSQIAAVLGISVSTVSRNILAGVRRIRQELEVAE